MPTALVFKAQYAHSKYDRSQKTPADLAAYLGDCAAIAFDLMVEAHNDRLPRGAQKYVITAPARAAIQVLGRSVFMHLSCPVENDHHHDDFASTVWQQAKAYGHEKVEVVRPVARLIGLA